MSQKKFAVFDIDGTLIRWQLYHAIVDELAKAGHIPKPVYKDVKQKRMAWKTRQHQNSFKEYEKTVVEAYENALPTIKPAVFDALAEQTAQTYTSQVYTYTRDLIAQLKSDGYVIIAISGSHKELLDHVAPQYGFDDWIGSTYHRDGEAFSGKKFIASFDKASSLKKLIDKHSLSLHDSYGVGDSKSDAAFLRLVDNPIAFNPDQMLLEIAKTENWTVILERKNVVYTITGLSTTTPHITTSEMPSD